MKPTSHSRSFRPGTTRNRTAFRGNHAPATRDRDQAGRGRVHRRLQRAEFFDLRGPDQLAEAVAHDDGRGNLVSEEVAAVRKDGGHSGPDTVAFDDGLMSDADVRYIRDGVQWPGREDADDASDVAGAGAIIRVLGSSRSVDACKQNGGEAHNKRNNETN